jgi:predicted Zn-dependent protease
MPEVSKNLLAQSFQDIDSKPHVYVDFGNFFPSCRASERLLTLTDKPNAHVAGGQVFINTGMLLQCRSPGQVASVLAHEIGHIMCDHVIESKTASLFWRFIAKYDGRYKDELELERVQESEAGHVRLMILAAAGFDPQSQIDALHDRMVWETRWNTQYVPEHKRSHPPVRYLLSIVEGDPDY